MLGRARHVVPRFKRWTLENEQPSEKFLLKEMSPRKRTGSL